MLYAIVMMMNNGILVAVNLPPGLGRIIAPNPADLFGLREAPSNPGGGAAAGLSEDWPKAGQTPSARPATAKARSMASFLPEYRALLHGEVRRNKTWDPADSLGFRQASMCFLRNTCGFDATNSPRVSRRDRLLERRRVPFAI